MEEGRESIFLSKRKKSMCVLQNTSRLIGLFWKGKKSEIGVDIIGPDVIKLFFMLSSAEHEILNVHRCKNSKNFSFFSGSDKTRMLFFLLRNVKMPTVIGILTFMSRKISCLAELSMEKVFLTSGPDLNFGMGNTPVL